MSKPADMLEGPNHVPTPPRPDRLRRLRRTSAVLIRWMLVGIAINVGVVWAIVLFNLGNELSYTSSLPAGQSWRMPGPLVRNAQSHVRTDSWGRTRIARTRSVPEVPAPYDLASEREMFFEKLGFPMRSLEWWSSESMTRVDAQWPQHGLIAVPNGKFDVVELPITPVWPGFAVNSLAYAATAWLVSRGIRGARRVICGKRPEPAAP